MCYIGVSYLPPKMMENGMGEARKCNGNYDSIRVFQDKN